MNPSFLSRRNLLRGLAGITVALPFLESVTNPRKVARAGGGASAGGYGGRPKRFIAWVNMFGTLPQYHQVSHDGSQLVFPAGSTMETLDPIKQYMTVLEGVNMASMYKSNGPTDFIGHASGACQALTGRPEKLVKHPWSPDKGLRMPLVDGQLPDSQGFNYWNQCYPSIDQAIANRMDLSGVKYKSVILGDNLDHAEGLFYGELEDVGLAIWNPVTLFKNFFSEFSSSASAIDALHDQRKSVLDAVLAESKDFTKRVSQRDLYAVQNHFDAIRDIEKSLAVVASCTIPAGVTDGFEGVNVWPDFIAQGLGTKRYELFFKLLALALKCDLLRVGGVQFSGHTLRLEDIVPDFATLSGGNNQGVHGYYAHAVWKDAPGTEIYRQIVRYKNKMFSDFILDLASADDGDGHTVLDNTLVFQTSEMLTGLHEVIPSHIWGYGNKGDDPGPYGAGAGANDDSPKRSTGLNMFYAGGGGGSVKTGKLFDFRNDPGYNRDRYAPDFGHYSHGEVMLTMARAMGVTPDALPSFGMPEVCQGEVSELLTGA
jgi:hypothetical protein